MIDENHIYTLSSDIEFSKFNEKEYLLHNSRLNKYTKINEKYYHLLNLVDGKKTISEIQKEYQKKNNTSLLNSQIIILFDQLEKYDVFGHSDIALEQIKIPNYIKFGFIFLKTNTVSKIVPILNFLFKKKIYRLVFILCLIMFSFNLYMNFYDYSKLNIIAILPYFLFLTFISLIFHELGHATASHYYKAKHGGIGFGFYLYFIPVFFADVTDVWRLNRWKRIIVNSAGVYFEIIFCLILSIIGFATKNQVIEVLALVISGKALYNLLPFLRADGYWILSDLFNKPNLNFHSINNLKIILFCFFKKKMPSFNKEDYYIALYGLFNVTIICIFLCFQIFSNRNSILQFPKTILTIINSIYYDGTLNISFNEIVKLLSILISYIITLKIVIMLIKKGKDYFFNLSR